MGDCRDKDELEGEQTEDRLVCTDGVGESRYAGDASCRLTVMLIRALRFPALKVRGAEALEGMNPRGGRPDDARLA